jgi:hypothetical protein
MNTVTIGTVAYNIGSTVSLKRNFETISRTFNQGHVFKITNIINDNEVLVEDSNGFILKIHKNNLI